MATWYILHIILNSICKFAITRKNNEFVANIENMGLTNFFCGNFCVSRKAANFCHPGSFPALLSQPNTIIAFRTLASVLGIP